MKYDVVVIGGGPAGLAAAVKAYDTTGGRVAVVERDQRAGGILNQCIHNGFGLHRFKEELTGPEYASRFEKLMAERPIDLFLGTMVIDLDPSGGLTALSETNGLFKLEAGAVVLAMGCRERPRGALNIPGSRPAGVFSAGTAQHLMNVEAAEIGHRAVILGSGDIGLIMARRMVLEGAEVACVVELMPYSGGLKRNIVQCLDDFGIPLYLSSTITRIDGLERVTGCEVSQVDENRQPIPGTERYFECDTILLSVGLIPESELMKTCGIELDPRTGGAVVTDDFMTSVPGIFACGNVLHVHDLVDFVSAEAEQAGVQAAVYAKHIRARRRDHQPADRPLTDRVPVEGGTQVPADRIPVEAGRGVRYTVPQMIHLETVQERLTLRFRVQDVYRDAAIVVYWGEQEIYRRKKRILAPGEMEQVLLKKTDLTKVKNPCLRVLVEGDNE